MIHTLNYWHGAGFLTGGVLDCDLAHRRSVAVLCMLYKIRCHPLHPLYGTLPVPYVPVRVRTSQYCKTFIPLLVSLWNGLDDPVFDGVGLAGFKSSANAFLLA